MTVVPSEESVDALHAINPKKRILKLSGGAIILLSGLVLLFLNEVRCVEKYMELQRCAGTVTCIGSNKIEPKHEKNLIHITGLATTDELLNDSKFGISVNALKLKRTVKVFQWQETKQTEPIKTPRNETESQTKYSYNPVWSETWIDSKTFHQPEGHENPSFFPYKPKLYAASRVIIGEFELPEALVMEINKYKTLSIDSNSMAFIGEHIDSDNIKLKDDELYIGKNADSPNIGDIRIGFKIVEPTMVTVIAQQSGNTLIPYKLNEGESIFLLKIGRHSADSMIHIARNESDTVPWILRISGWSLVFLGLFAIFRYLSSTSDIVSFWGNIAQTDMGVLAFMVASALFFLTISLAWIDARPSLAISLILISTAFIAGIKILPR